MDTDTWPADLEAADPSGAVTANRVGRWILVAELDRLGLDARIDRVGDDKSVGIGSLQEL